MAPLLRRHATLWAGWILISTLLLFTNPLIPFGWAELSASLGSLCLALDRRLRREMAFAIGLPVVALLAGVDGGGLSILRLGIDWGVLAVGILLGARAVDDQIELESIAGHLALGPDAERALAELRSEIAREIGRARRHERPFVVLSIAPHAHALAAESEGGGESRILAELARARWMIEVREVASRELHLYARAVATPDRVLCLVPETEPETVDALVARIRRSASQRLDLEVAIGAAAFPADALHAEGLVEAADADRASPRLSSVSTPEPAPMPEGAAEASRG